LKNSFDPWFKVKTVDWLIFNLQSSIPALSHSCVKTVNENPSQFLFYYVVVNKLQPEGQT
jgi:hypothetical protein